MTPSQRHDCMAAIHSVSTKPEILLRKSLWSLGFRYRINDHRLPGSPDIVLPKYRSVIFVHGCFWHGHNGCGKYRIPKTNSDFWTSKITRNMQRDQEVWRQLEAKGWFVIIVWECELKKKSLPDTVSRVSNILKENAFLCSQNREYRRKIREAYRMDAALKKQRESQLLEEIKGMNL